MKATYKAIIYSEKDCCGAKWTTLTILAGSFQEALKKAEDYVNVTYKGKLRSLKLSDEIDL